MYPHADQHKSILRLLQAIGFFNKADNKVFKILPENCKLRICRIQNYKFSPCSTRPIVQKTRTNTNQIVLIFLDDLRTLCLMCFPLVWKRQNANHQSDFRDLFHTTDRNQFNLSPSLGKIPEIQSFNRFKLLCNINLIQLIGNLM